MDAKQNSFSLYDFLGYFTPGAVFYTVLLRLLIVSLGINYMNHLLLKALTV